MAIYLIKLIHNCCFTNDRDQDDSISILDCKESLSFYLVIDRGQVEAKLLPLTKELLGFHLFSDQG